MQFTQGEQKLSLIVYKSIQDIWARPQQPALAWRAQGSCKTQGCEVDISQCVAGGPATAKDGKPIKSAAFMAF